MSWREMLRAEVTDDQQLIKHNLKKPVSKPSSADCADIADRESKLNVSKQREQKQSHEERQSRLMECLADACKGLEITPMEIHKALSPDDIKEWESGDLTLEELSAFADLLVDRRSMDRGERPDHFTEKAHCRQCGPVYLWISGTVLGCPWCFNRAADRPIPRPRSVRCGECCHFERVSYHPHLGHCTMGEPEAVAGLWDSDRRYCLRYIPHPQQSTNVLTGATEAKTKS
ncbi:MAG: hypothetical protein HN661_11660 [Gammaproteobacteria bacterium]|nr:hypothetical protein [Thiotrichales bacterium]MBT7480156.1 hypothetical protein [Gammaproteobacteria bacterium]